VWGKRGAQPLLPPPRNRVALDLRTPLMVWGSSAPWPMTTARFVPQNAAWDNPLSPFLRVFHFAMAVKGRALRRALPAALRSAPPA
jgi:hypothetical protein